LSPRAHVGRFGAVAEPQGGSTPGSSASWSRTLIAGLVAVVVIGLVVGVVVIASGSDDPAEATEVYTEPISTPGEDPFTPAVGTDEEIPAVEAPGTYEGNHVGLYGGTLNQSTCDRDQLVTFLRQNPDKAAAWAGVLGISTTRISTYVAGLTPVILRSDTLVTNHGFADGRATVIPAVLQAGTAVLIDDKGFPVTKCYCGNPLTPPDYYSPKWEPRYQGPTWPGFSGTSITIIQSSATIIDTFVLVDPRTGRSFDRPRGSGGAQDTPTNPPSTTTTTTTTLAPTTTLPPSTTVAPSTQPSPTTLPPPTTTQSQLTPEQRAVAILNDAANRCYPFPAPIQQSYGENTVTTSGTGPTFVLTVVTHDMQGAPLQTFTWNVDRATLKFTPTNDLAQAASNFCYLIPR
jgi:hypothetical protein